MIIGEVLHPGAVELRKVWAFSVTPGFAVPAGPAALRCTRLPGRSALQCGKLNPGHRGATLSGCPSLVFICSAENSGITNSTPSGHVPPPHSLPFGSSFVVGLSSSSLALLVASIHFINFSAIPLTASRASLIFVMSLPPAIALSGLPPPAPPAIFAVSRTIFPA